MKKAIFALVAVAGFAVSTNCKAQDSFETEISVDYLSEYMWRGMRLTNDPVLQPGITGSYKGFSANVWVSIDQTDINEVGDHDWRIQEVDYALSYELPFGSDFFSMELGFIHYEFHGTDYQPTQEVYASMGLDILLSPKLTIYADVDAADNAFYGVAEIGHSFGFTDKLSLDLGGTLAYGSEDYGSFYYGLEKESVDYTLSAGVTYQFSDGFSMGASATYCEQLINDINDTMGTYDGNNMIYGVNMTYAF